MGQNVLMMSAKRGHIITFYSYKGGVGRSRAMANVAYQLAESGQRVLCIDFDLEAPDLARYLAQEAGSRERLKNEPGLIDLFSDYRDYLLIQSPFMRRPDWTRLVQPVEIRSKKEDRQRPVMIDYIGPGRQTKDYGEKVVGYDWGAFYESWEGGGFIEHLRNEFATNYDWTLIDSRTGTSDIGGLCTIQFPSILVLVFSTSPGSLAGLELVVNSIVTQQAMIRGGDPLPIIPLPCKADKGVIVEEYLEWFSRLSASRMGELLRQLDSNVDTESVFQEILIEYQSWYSYNDILESQRENITDPGSNAYRYAKLIRLIRRAGAQTRLGGDPMNDPLPGSLKNPLFSDLVNFPNESLVSGYGLEIAPIIQAFLSKSGPEKQFLSPEPRGDIR